MSAFRQGSTAALTLVVACTRAAPGPCDRYADHAEVEAWCRVSGAGAAADVDDWCGPAGPWEVACRSAWVEARLRDPAWDRAQLLRACGAAAPCALDVLDHRPATTVSAQLGECRSHTGDLVGHCVHHAVQRWSRTRPDRAQALALEEQARSQPDPVPRWVAFHLGELAACSPGFGCDDLKHGDMARHCAEGAAPYRSGQQPCGSAPSGAAGPPPRPHHRPGPAGPRSQER